MKLFKKITELLSNAILDDQERYKIQYSLTYIILGVVAIFMTIVNIVTQKGILIWATLAYAILTFLNALFVKIGDVLYQISKYLFAIEIITLFTFFFVTGNPEGFSAIWSLLLPGLGILLFGLKSGSIASLVMFIIIIFFFWTPFGQSLVQYEYTASFMLRFPFAYIAFYFVGTLFEKIRSTTFDNYKFFYTHDSLTGALNRKGFQEFMNSKINVSKSKMIGYMMADLDHFKNINDEFGHFAGDEILKKTSSVISSLIDVPLCRWGGEEFTAIFPEGEITEEQMQSIVQAVSNIKLIIDAREVTVTISLGAVLVNKDSISDENELWKIADGCLYEAKETGRNKVIFRIIE